MSDRRRSDVEPSIHRSQVEKLLDVTRELASTSDFHMMLKVIARAIVEVVQFDAVAINLVEEDTGDLRTVVVDGPPELAHLRGRLAARSEWDALLESCEQRGPLRFLVGDVAELELPTWRSGDADWYERHADDPQAWSVDYGLYVPLHETDGELVGIISVDLPRSGLMPDAEQSATLALLSRQAETAINTTRRLARSELNERIYRLAFESAPAVKFVVDGAMRIVDVNRMFLDVFGPRVRNVAEVDRRISALDGGPTLASIVEDLFVGHGDGDDRRFVADHDEGAETRWYQVVVHAVTDVSTKPFRVVCTLIDITAERQARARHLHEAAHDPLTGLLNRRGGPQAIDALVRRADGHGVLAVMLCDLDGFKALNDRYGHGFGDDTLVKVAQRLSGLCDDDTVVMRQGGDEFVVAALRPDAPSAAEMAAAVVQAFDTPIRVGAVVSEISMSVGTALGDLADRPDVRALVEAADAALLRAKRAGKDRWEIADVV